MEKKEEKNHALLKVVSLSKREDKLAPVRAVWLSGSLAEDRRGGEHKGDPERGWGHLLTERCQGLRTGGSQRVVPDRGRRQHLAPCWASRFSGPTDIPNQKLRSWDTACYTESNKLFRWLWGLLTFKNYRFYINDLHCPKRWAKIWGRLSCLRSTRSRNPNQTPGRPDRNVGVVLPGVGDLDGAPDTYRVSPRVGPRNTVVNEIGL